MRILHVASTQMFLCYRQIRRTDPAVFTQYVISTFRRPRCAIPSNYFASATVTRMANHLLRRSMGISASPSSEKRFAPQWRPDNVPALQRRSSFRKRFFVSAKGRTTGSLRAADPAFLFGAGGRIYQRHRPGPAGVMRSPSLSPLPPGAEPTLAFRNRPRSNRRKKRSRSATRSCFHSPQRIEVCMLDGHGNDKR